MNKYEYVLFDLDGTISESAMGVRKSIEYTLKKFGKDIPDLSDYTVYVGPPIYDTFKNYCKFDVSEIEDAVNTFRDHYNREGKLLNKLYDGMDELLRELKENGVKTAVCSSKYEKFAYEVVDILGISQYFDAICGSSPDKSRQDKVELIPYAITLLGGKIENDRKKTVMIGDTVFDAKGANLCGVDFIGAEYGYGDKKQMLSEGAKAFVKTPMEILPLIIEI